MPGDDLFCPLADGAAEPAELAGHLAIGDVAADLVDPFGSELDVGVVVDLADDLFRVPREPHLTMRVARAQEAEHPVVPVSREPFVGDRGPAACPPERVVASAAVTVGLVPHLATALVKRRVGELDHMERIGDLHCVGQHRVEHRPKQRRQVERRLLDRSAPRRVTVGDPAARFGAIPSEHAIEEPTAADIDDLG